MQRFKGKQIEVVLGIILVASTLLLAFFLATPLLRAHVELWTFFVGFIIVSAAALISLEILKRKVAREDAAQASGSGVVIITSNTFDYVLRNKGDVGVLREMGLNSGYARVLGETGRIIIEGFVYTIKIAKIFGKDTHIVAKWVSYSLKGEERSYGENLGRVDKIYFLEMRPQEVESMLRSGEIPEFFRGGK